MLEFIVTRLEVGRAEQLTRAVRLALQQLTDRFKGFFLFFSKISKLRKEFFFFYRPMSHVRSISIALPTKVGGYIEGGDTTAVVYIFLFHLATSRTVLSRSWGH